MQEWMSDIQPLIRAGASGGGGGGLKKKRNSLTKSGVREYEVDEDGSAAGERRNSFGGDQGGSGGAILKKGWLDKRGELNTAWKGRYFVLTAEDPYRDVPKTLRYYKDEESARVGKSGGAIECGPSCVASKASSDDPSHPYYFEVTMPTRTYMLAAKSAAEVDEWVELIAGGSSNPFAPPATPAASSGSASTRNAPVESITSMASFTMGGPLNEVHSGWMKKKGGVGLFGGKMQRYFVLYDNRELHYFEGSSMENIQRKGRIRLAEATAMMRMKPDDRKDFTYVIKVPGRDWTLDPGSLSLWQEWESKLAPMIGGD